VKLSYIAKIEVFAGIKLHTGAGEIKIIPHLVCLWIERKPVKG